MPVGVFYGYMLSFFHPYLRGHNALNSVLLNDDVDVIFSPSAYKPFRGTDSVNAFNFTLDNSIFHNKIYMHEIDNTTFLTVGNKYAESEIAVFSDAKKSRFLVDDSSYDMIYSPPGEGKKSIALQYDMVYNQQNGLSCIGAPVTYYISDYIIYSKFPHDRTKLYVFLNLLAPSDEIEKRIIELRKSGKSMLFLYAPGYVENDGYSLKAMNELTGFDFLIAKEENDGEVYYCKNPEIKWGKDRGITSLFTVADKDVNVITRYTKSKLPSGVIKRRGNAIDAWFSCGSIPGNICRLIAKEAEIFLWHDGDDPVYINKSMFGMYSFCGGKKPLTFLVTAS